jgi:transcriptional regulator with XRE-family HTH domain
MLPDGQHGEEASQTINTNLLKGRMVECGYTQEALALELGISTNALNLKLNNKSEFKASEIKELSELLQIEDKKDAYFFN